MALFIRQPQTSDSVRLYTVGQHKTILLVGLGNVGKQYVWTRHNVGFLCLDEFTATNEEMQNWIEKKDLKCYVSTGRMGEAQVVAIKPTTMMNLSGQAVQATANFYKVPLSQIVVIHDDIDINFGQIRLRMGGAAAGHNGVKSVSQAIGEDYGRVRVGIGPKKPEQIDSADFVLQQFSSDEQTHMHDLYREVAAVLTEYIYSGQLPHDTRSFLV